MKILSCIFIFGAFLANAQVVIDNRGGANNGANVVKRPTKKVKAKELKVLFVGDSYSAFNSLTQLVQYAGAQLKNPLNIVPGTLTSQGSFFATHLNNKATTEALKKYKWDYVVFQGSARSPLDDPESFKKNGAALAKLAIAHKAKPIFFMTWADNGELDKTKEIFDIYKTMAQENNAILAPVGSAWFRSIKKHPKIKLFLKDSSHPSPHGTYLTAAVLATTITRQSTAGIKNTGLKSISSKEALALQRISTQTIVDYEKYLKKRAPVKK